MSPALQPWWLLVGDAVGPGGGYTDMGHADDWAVAGGAKKS